MSETCNSNCENIAKNAQSIADLNDLIVGLSLQVSQITHGNDRPPEHPNHYSTRLTKVEFPKFDGNDLKSWLYKCNQFFELDHVSDSHRVKLAAIHMEGKALLWHQTYMKRLKNITPTWARYTEDIQVRFGELYDDRMAELKALVQTGSVQEYHDTFDALVSRLDLTEEHQLSCYLGGLEEDIQLAVRMFTPKSVQQALCLAKLQEASGKAKKTKKPPLLPNPTNTKSTPNPPPFTKHTPFKPFPNTNPHRKTLTLAEFNEKRAKNLCFWCDEKYEPGHKCKGKKPQLYHLEVEGSDSDEMEDKEEENVTQCAQISIQALDGATSFQTMRVTGYHGKKNTPVTPR